MDPSPTNGAAPTATAEASAPGQFLLLRGLGREQRHWGGFPALLRQRAAGAGVHCLDLPGTGTEHGRDCPVGMSAMAADLRARWLPLRAAHPGPWRLVGVSLGGMLAMQWCANHPADFAGVALVNTSAGGVSPPWRRMGLRIVPQIVLAMATRDAVAREQRILGMTTTLLRDVAATARDWARFGEDRPVRRVTVLRQILTASGFRAPASLLPDTLVVVGGRDPLADPRCGADLAAHFGAPIALHPRAGHDLSTDDPEWFADTLAAWSQGPQRRPSDD